MDFIGALIFIVVVILSLASKAQESRKIAERQREKQNRQPQQLSDKARQQIHGRPQKPRTATAREGATPPPPPPPRPVRKPKPVEQELLETLFGVKLDKESQETSESPTRQPNIREATQQMVQRLRGEPPADPRRAKARKAAPPVDAADEGPTVTVADIRAKEGEFQTRIRSLRERMHQGMRQGLAQKPVQTDTKKKPRQKAAQQRPAAPQPVRPVRRPQRPVYAMFSTREDLRRAIIASEVLGPPRSMREDSAA